MSDKIKPIAIYLPQFHPTPENDEWWGKGFTEWTNVTKATPRFEGHYQPHLPADLGFYDLRLEEARLAQEQMAKKYGIYGFCYYHYWFNGKKMLHEPLERKLKNPKEDFPFMMCWANENWTRTWDGGDQEILLKQDYSEEDDLEHIKALIPYFKDSRYIRVLGKPVFIFYRPQLFPNILKTAKLWREEAIKAGIGELHLGYTQSFGFTKSPSSLGLDFAVEFQPKFERTPSSKQISLQERILRKLHINKLPHNVNHLIDYYDFAVHQIKNGYSNEVLPCIFPGWDNSARRKSNAFILNESTPEKYGKWLSDIIQNYPWDKSKEKMLFINAWNEWAEGNHLEPCQKWGLSYLEETKDILEKNKQ